MRVIDLIAARPDITDGDAVSVLTRDGVGEIEHQAADPVRALTIGVGPATHAPLQPMPRYLQVRHENDRPRSSGAAEHPAAASEPFSLPGCSGHKEDAAHVQAEKDTCSKHAFAASC